MIAYVYMGYPFLAFFLGILKKKKIDKNNSYQPNITILIAAYNEEENIAETIRNKLSQDYPVEKVQIIVISDESTDKTDNIVKKFENNGVRLLRQVPRAGKTSALNLGIKFASGDILVFSDANSIYEKNVLKRLVRNFHDPQVGYVTGKMIYTNPDGSTIGDGCSSYMKYENLLRKIETDIGSVVGVDGGIDAARKKLYQPMNQDQLPDFVLPLKVVEQGYRVVYEAEALLKEQSLKSSDDEYRMRVRVSLRALWALKDMRSLLWNKKNIVFSWQLWSHKLLRYFCFIFLIIAYFSNLKLWSDHKLFSVLFIIQTAGYTGALFAPFLFRFNNKFRILFFVHYFVLLNLASMHACVKFLLGKKQITWSPRKG
jgi:cellulose synthase/poly-beta-1,6-N-acetylglucosamine synthase-like glycosyltransferase